MRIDARKAKLICYDQECRRCKSCSCKAKADGPSDMDRDPEDRAKMHQEEEVDLVKGFHSPKEINIGMNLQRFSNHLKSLDR